MALKNKDKNKETDKKEENSDVVAILNEAVDVVYNEETKKWYRVSFKYDLDKLTLSNPEVVELTSNKAVAVYKLKEYIVNKVLKSRRQ